MDTRRLTDTLVVDLDPIARPVVTRYLAWSPLLIAAVTISTARLSLAAAAARRCAQLRAAG